MQRNAPEPSFKRGVERTGRRETEGVALCFKVSFKFRHRFKLEAVRRNLSMTEFLIRATESYLGADGEAAGPISQNHVDGHK
ncbi:MAG TPA: hypothetical protein VGC34_13660 [Steroidobacteraceae bacterium]